MARCSSYHSIEKQQAPFIQYLNSELLKSLHNLWREQARENLSPGDPSEA